MSKSEIILFGAGGHAHACIDVIEQDGRYRIAGLVGMQDELQAQHLGYSVIATDDDMQRLAGKYQQAFITVGQLESPDTRMRLLQKILNLGFALPSFVAPSAYVSKHARIEAGTIVMHGAIVNAGATVGKNCIINSRALVEHDVVVGDNCHVSTGAILNGSVRVGSGSFVGSGCVIRDRIALGQRCIVGMGLCVRHDQADNAKIMDAKTS